MRTTILSAVLLIASVWCSLAASQQQPRYDFHQHLMSPAVAKLIGAPRPFLAPDLIAQMDRAGLQRALVLSMAYQFGNPHRPPVANEYAMVQAENNWTAQQVKAYPDRLQAVCGVDPLRDYALVEIERCSRNPSLRAGLKLHFGNSDVDLDNPEHVEKLRKIFRAADTHGMAIIVHMHANFNLHRPYGRREAQIFLTQILPEAPHIYVQVAHLAGGGGFDDLATDEALQVFIEAIARRDARVARVYFDISGVAGLGEWESKKEVIAARMRAIGVKRILFGCDGAWTEFTPVKAIAAYRQLPLTAEEFQTIDTNVPPYFTTK